MSVDQNKKAIFVSDLKKSFGIRPVLEGISFSIQEGETVVVIGPSGCGKTTLLRCINGLEPADSGVISVLGYDLGPNRSSNISVNSSRYRSLDELRSDVGMVFQHLYLWPHKTIRQNIIEAPILLGKLSKVEANGKCRALLDRVGLSEKADDYPHSLSGGQQQRAAIARALAMNPRILLLDEITSALDPELVFGILEILEELTHQGRTMFIVTHEMRFAREAADRILFIADGKVLEDSTPEEFFESPQTKRASDFLNRVTRIRK